MRRFVLALSILIPALLVLLAIAYASFPQWAPGLIRDQLPQEVKLNELTLKRPTTDGIDIQRVSVDYHRYQVRAENIDVRWSLTSLLAKRVLSVDLARLRVVVGEPTEDKPLPEPPDLATLFAQLPADRIKVADVRVEMPSTELSVAGTAEIDPTAAKLSLHALTPPLVAGYQLTATVEPAGAIRASLNGEGKPSRAAVEALWPSGGNWSGQVQASLHPELLNTLTPNFGLFSDVIQIELDGSLSGHWPPSIATLDQAQADFDLTWMGRFDPYIERGELKLKGNLQTANKAIELRLMPFATQRLVFAQEKPFALLQRTVPAEVNLETTNELMIRYQGGAFTLNSGMTVHAGDEETKIIASLGNLQGRIDVSTNALSGLATKMKLSAVVSRPEGRHQIQADAELALDNSTWHVRIANASSESTGLKGYVIDHASLVTNEPVEARWISGTDRAGRLELDPVTVKVTAPAIPVPAIQGGLEVAEITLTDLHFDNAEGLRTDVAGTGTLKRNTLHLPVTGKASLGFANSLLKGPFEATGKHSGFAAAGELQHNTESREGNLSYRVDWQHASPWMAALTTRWREPFDIDRGHFVSDGQLKWWPPRRRNGEWRIQGQGQFSVDELDAHYDDSLLKKLRASGRWSLSDAGVAISRGDLTIGEVSVGASLTEIRTAFSFASGVADISGAEAKALGGTVHFSPILYRLDSGEADFRVTLSSLDLAQVLALEGEHVRGEGTLDGELPVVLRANLPTIANGNLKAREPGGVIQYFDAPSLAAYARDQGFEFALAALADYRFHTLNAKVNYADDHTLKLALRLEGRNPAVEAGRPIHYNLNITENVADLLRSLRLADRVTEEVEQRVQ